MSYPINHVYAAITANDTHARYACYIPSETFLSNDSLRRVIGAMQRLSDIDTGEVPNLCRRPLRLVTFGS